MGCNCGGSGARTAAARAGGMSRVTVFQVVVDGGVVSEFEGLPEARTEAARLGGRVSVNTKTVGPVGPVVEGS